MRYSSWNVSCNTHKFLSFWAISCRFSPTKTKKIQILKLKKIPGYIIHLYICTINENHMSHMMLCDIEHNEQNLLLFQTVFLLFYPHDNPKNQHFKNSKRSGDIIISHVSHKRQSHDVWFLRYQAQQIVFFLSFWTIFLLLPH